VIIAMVAMRMVNTAADEVVDMVAVRDCLVAAARTMAVSIAAMLRGAADRVQIVDFNDVLIGLSATGVEQMAVLQIIDMVSMADSEVSAVRAMLVCGAGHAYLLPIVAPHQRGHRASKDR
jgi:hypothetical protein